MTDSIAAFPLRLQELPPAPSAELDPYLDAALACIARYGIARTSVNDIAHEAGVSRATVYRHVGTVDDVVKLLLAREIDRLIQRIPELAGTDPGPHSVVEVVAGIAEYASEHPAWQKVLRDEPELLGPYVVDDFGSIVNRIASVVVPWFEEAMRQGIIAHTDPTALAEWLVRITVSLVVAPPVGEIRAFLEPVVVPLLTPRPDRPTARSSPSSRVSRRRS